MIYMDCDILENALDLLFSGAVNIEDEVYETMGNTDYYDEKITEEMRDEGCTDADIDKYLKADLSIIMKYITIDRDKIYLNQEECREFNDFETIVYSVPFSFDYAKFLEEVE